MKRTGHFARHMALLLALLLLSALFLPACQPTPEEDIVVNKGDGALMELVLATAAPEQEQTARVPYSAPARYEEAFVGYSDNLSVEIDAEVIAPPEAPIPVYEAQLLEWTDAQADACICALIGDVTLYEQTSALSKAEVEALIVECQRELSDPNSDLNTILQFGGTQAEYEAGKANVEATLAALEQQWQHAPETVERKVVERRFLEDGTRASIVGGAKLADGATAEVAVHKMQDPGRQKMTIHVSRGLGVPFLFSRELTDLKGLTCSAAAAEAQAQAALEAMGLAGQYRLAFAGSATTHSSTSTSPDDAPKCYMFYYCQQLSGIPILYAAPQDAQTTLYAGAWPYETMCFGVNDSGILYFEWVSPIAAGRLLNADVPLLPFEEVMQRFRSSIAASYLPINTVGNVDEYRLTIDRIEFGYTRVAMPDRQSVGMLVPSWGFYGVEKDYYRNAAATQQILDEDNCHMQDTPGHCFLTINAIDGSVIDRIVGY